MIYKIARFEAIHYYKLSENIEPERGIQSSTEVMRIGKTFERQGVGKTAFLDDEVIASAGIMISWPGMGTAWALISPIARKHRMFIHRVIFKSLNEYIRELKLRRVEANVESDFTTGIRWVEALGFKFESDMPLFGPQGQDFKKYVILSWL